MLENHPVESISGIAITGTGGKLATELIGGIFVNEIIAQATSACNLFPDAQTVMEIGGEDSKLIFLEKDPKDGKSRLVDFEMNSICAAGTGSFLDQQAKRIGVSIENEFGQMALKSVDPPRIAGRCSVFAKSDIQPLIEALVRNGYARLSDVNLQARLETEVCARCQEIAIHRRDELTGNTGGMQSKLSELVLWTTQTPRDPNTTQIDTSR